MRIAVSGAHGFLGSATVSELLSQGEAVRALVTPWADLRRLDGLDPELTTVDLTGVTDLAPALEGCDAVIHLAAAVRDWGREARFREVNVRGTARLLDAAARAGVGRFVHVSSVAVHRYSGYLDADPETAPLDGDINAYARTKVAAEKLVRGSGLDWVIVRPGLWPYGAEDPSLKKVAAALKRGLLPLSGGGRSRINTVHSGNLAHGLHRAVLAPAAVGRTVVVADDGAPSWKELFTEIAELCGARPPRLDLPLPLARFAGAVSEDVFSVIAPDREPPLTRYRAALMQADVHFSGEGTRELLGYRPRRSRTEALELSLGQYSS